MREYTVIPVSGNINWDGVPALASDVPCWLPDAGISMTTKLCYDSENLYVLQACTEKNILARFTGSTDSVCNDSCMELFFAPVEGDRRYINFETNPNGALYVAIGEGRYDRIRLLALGPKEVFEIQTERTEKGWTAQYRIPVSFLRTLFYGFSGFKRGMVIMANAYKCGDETVIPHYLAWNPVKCSVPDFHRSCDFGKLILG